MSCRAVGGIRSEPHVLQALAGAHCTVGEPHGRLRTRKEDGGVLGRAPQLILRGTGPIAIKGGGGGLHLCSRFKEGEDLPHVGALKVAPGPVGVEDRLSACWRDAGPRREYANQENRAAPPPAPAVAEPRHASYTVEAPAKPTPQIITPAGEAAPAPKGSEEASIAGPELRRLEPQTARERTGVWLKRSQP